MIRRTARAAAAIEAAADGVALAWAPMLDVYARCSLGALRRKSLAKIRCIGAMFGVAMVEGYTGQAICREPDTVMATAKHFAGYGFVRGGRDYNAVDASPYRMHNVVLPPFKAAVDAGVGAIMVGFHDLCGHSLHRAPETADGSVARAVGL